MTGKPEARLWVVLPNAWVTPGEHTVAVRMVRRDGTIEGPHQLRFHPGEQLLADAKYAFDSLGESLIAFAEHSDLYTWLMLSHLFGMKESLREIRYSVDDCSLRRRIVLGAPPGALAAVPPPEPPPPSASPAAPPACACAPQPVMPVALRVRRHSATWLVELRVPHCARSRSCASASTTAPRGRSATWASST